MQSKEFVSVSASRRVCWPLSAAAVSLASPKSLDNRLLPAMLRQLSELVKNKLEVLISPIPAEETFRQKWVCRKLPEIRQECKECQVFVLCRSPGLKTPT